MTLGFIPERKGFRLLDALVVPIGAFDELGVCQLTAFSAASGFEEIYANETFLRLWQWVRGDKGVRGCELQSQEH